MVIISLKGGLGNQLFQYAMAYDFARKKNHELYIDNTAFEMKNTHRDNGLVDFNFPITKADQRSIQRLENPYSIFSKLYKVAKRKITKDYNVGWKPELIETKKNDVFFEGYFQSYKYFEDSVEDLKLFFTLKDQLHKGVKYTEEEINHCNSVSLHVRRGDYVTNKKVERFFNICNHDYYTRAIDMMRSLIGPCKLFVFSDDPAWVRENMSFPGIDFKIVSSNVLRPAQEMYLMSRCKHNVIPNSTFAWWGAYMNPNKNKVVVCPSLWSRDSQDFKYLIPHEWTRLGIV